jgi:hypothetical protein
MLSSLRASSCRRALAGMKLGHRVSDIHFREDYVKDHPERRAELDALGFRWNSLAW